jgi:hypothetical protein
MTEAAQIEAAAQAKEAATAALYRDDGSKVFGDEEHKERMTAIRREHAAAFDRIESDISRKVGEAEQELLVAENADLASTLTIEESQRVSALSGFVADDVARLPLAALEKRCRAALVGGDKASMFLLSHYAGRRAEEEGAYELGDAVAELRAKVAPDQERKLADAREALEEAQALREQAYYRRRGVDDAVGLYHQQTYGHLSQGVRGAS